MPGRKKNTGCFCVVDDVSSKDYTCQFLDFKENFHSGAMTQMWSKIIFHFTSVIATSGVAQSLTFQISTSRFLKCELRCRFFTQVIFKIVISSFPCLGSFLLFVPSVKFISLCFCHGMLWKVVWCHEPDVMTSDPEEIDCQKANRKKVECTYWRQMSETWIEDALESKF